MPCGNIVTIKPSSTRGGGAFRTWDVSDTNIDAILNLLNGSGNGSGTDVTTATYTYLGKIDSDGEVSDTSATGGAN